MLEKDVVFGAEDKLRSTIDGAIEIIDADAYFVLVGCTAGIIGEDVPLLDLNGKSGFFAKLFKKK